MKTPIVGFASLLRATNEVVFDILNSVDAPEERRQRPLGHHTAAFRSAIAGTVVARSKVLVTGVESPLATPDQIW